MTNDPMTAQSLDEAQRHVLSALLDTILPASEDGRMPSAAELDFAAYLSGQASGFLATLPGILDRFDNAFAGQALPARVAAVEAFARDDAPAFDALLVRVYDCYYQDDRVRALIGAVPAPPFPRGNTIPAGDLSGLAAVAERSLGFRR
jgi:hypothetical protein